MSAALSSSAGSPAAVAHTDEADRLRRAIALMQDHVDELGPEVTELVIAPLRQRLVALEARDGDDVGVPRLRIVSVLFVDVVDSTALVRGLDAEDAYQVLDGALRRFAAAVHEHGGRVLRYTGDGLKTVFGMPEPADDDPVRAVRAGLEIMRHARLHAVEVNERYGLAGFALRAGIHTGPVAVGADAEDAHALVGPTLHLAACLEQNAPPGGLCISHDTWVALRGAFDVQAREPLRVNGLEAPVRSYRVQRERSLPD
jgi:class 3 adenylate cyclase